MISKIFLGALLLSIWCVLLFWGKTIGLSMLLFVIPFVCFTTYLLEKKEIVKNKRWKILILPIILLSSTYCLYNNSFLNAVNILVIPSLFFIMIIKMLNEEMKLAILFEDVVEIILTPISYLGSTAKKLIAFIKYKLNFKEENNQNKSKIIKGVLITIPIVFWVIVLLSSADEIFGEIFINLADSFFGTVFELNIVTFIMKVIATICVFFYLSSFFDYLISTYKASTTVIEKNNESVLMDKTTIKISLTALNIVYIIFCIVQIKSLFMKYTDINYSDYARKGFFQLMIVSIINFVMLLLSKRKNEKSNYINIMCIIMIICTSIILISSAYRMNLYENAYGYTTLRLLVYVTLFTEAVLLVPTVFYVIDKPIDIFKVYFVIILIAYLSVNLVNINNIIAEKNVSRYFETNKIDTLYLKNDIGIDAIPALSHILETEPDITEVDLHLEIEEYIKNSIEKLENEDMDFRNFNISKLLIKRIEQYL